MIYYQFFVEWDLGSWMTYTTAPQIENIPQLAANNHLGWATGDEKSIFSGRISIIWLSVFKPVTNQSA